MVSHLSNSNWTAWAISESSVKPAISEPRAFVLGTFNPTVWLRGVEYSREVA